MNQESFSPDGRIRVDWGVSTGRMSHEIWSPRIIDVETGQVLLDLWEDGSWDASIRWLEDGLMHMSIRHYSEGGATILKVTVDRTNNIFRVDDGEPQPLNRLPEQVPKAFWRKSQGHD